MQKKILEKILTRDNIIEVINNNLDILVTIIPEIKYMIELNHKNPNYHLYVWNHTILALSLSENNYIVRLTLLLHGIEKQFSYNEEVLGKISYEILTRLNYDKEFIYKICCLVYNYDDELSKEEIEDNYELSLLRYKIQCCEALVYPNEYEKRKQYLRQINKYLQDKKIYNNLILIAAIGKNNELGKDNKLIWPLKEDLKFFRNQTMGNKIIMGYNTYLSLPKLLPGRKHIILTHRDTEFPKEVDVYHSKEELLQSISDDEDIYVIGGASIYKQLIDNSSQMLLTEIDKIDTTANAYFPQFNKDNWTSIIIDSNIENGIKYKHIKYLRKK
jgi:dihydrofolate reductase